MHVCVGMKLSGLSLSMHIRDINRASVELSQDMLMDPHEHGVEWAQDIQSLGLNVLAFLGSDFCPAGLHGVV